MALVGEPGLGGEPGEVALPARKSLERVAGAETRAMRCDRVACLGAENTTEVMRRRRQEPAEGSREPGEH
jgi:hypothetical protein